MEGEPCEDPEGDGAGLWGDTTGWGGVVGFLNPGVILPLLLVDSPDSSSDTLASCKTKNGNLNLFEMVEIHTCYNT